MAMPMPAGQQDFQSLVLSCNKDGMDSLRKGQLKAAFEQFKYAEATLIANQADGDNTSLLAVTCNNLGCYYKKIGKFHGALSYLRRALKMEVDLNTDEVTLAGTHLNICAMLSKLEKHDKAVQHALSALDLINKRVDGSDPDLISQDDYSVLAIAYHNVAVERDFLQQYDKAASAFQQGFQVAKRCLGEDHPLAITLGKNCDAVLQKSMKFSKAPPSTLSQSFSKSGGQFTPRRSQLQEPQTPTRPSMLPSIAGVQPSPRVEKEAPPMPQRSSVRQQAADWVASETAEWHSFAHATLGGGAQLSTTTGTSLPVSKEGTMLPTPRAPLPHRASAALREAQMADLDVPTIKDTASVYDPLATSRSRRTPRRTPLAQALEDHPEALMDIVDADRTGHNIGAIARATQNDYRPNRMIKGSTRTSRVVRRTGMMNSTKHRDLIMSGRNRSQLEVQKSAYVQKVAAERIQRAWRAWHKYCEENGDWMNTTWICATMIQSNWRSYHVRRLKHDRASTMIQRHVRGHLVRKMLRKHQAAVSIQRHAVGMLTRMQLRKLHVNAVKVQSLIRGGLARKRVRKHRHFKTQVALTIQCAVRDWITCRVTRARREMARQERVRDKAVLDIQRFYRGHKGRRRFTEVKEQYMRDLQEFKAATRLQALVRRDKAIKRVDKVRAAKLEQMHKSATFVRKMYLGAKSRRRYNELLSEFARHERHIITIQRFSRGFLVRLRMWREAIRAEEELWAALEIQRIWRGYHGRVKWETKYEEVWRREMSAALMQRQARGWLARLKAGRMKRQIARAEFERARKRFRAAQRIQAMVRGVLSRKVSRAMLQRATLAAMQLQRIWRGHVLRNRLWAQVLELRATMLQAAARGFLVRRRRLRLVSKVICIQRGWRCWKRRPEHVKALARENRAERKEKAALIQGRYRAHKERKEIDHIQQTQTA